MSKVVIAGDASGTGTFTISAPNGNTDRTLVLPDEAGTVLTTAGVPASAMPAGSVLQVVNNTSVLNFSTSNTSDTDTGFSVSITPTNASSKILVLYNGNWSLQASNTSWTLSLYRGATDLGEFSTGYGASGGWIASQASFFYLDSPLTTSATTYKLYVKEGALAGTVSSNLVVHSLIALEIAA